jgi:hypothetical protein
MVMLSKKIALACAAAAMLSVMPYSIEGSKLTGITIAADQAQAVIGRPLTPGSAAGVARRTTRRVVRRHCVRVLVHGVYVCR